MRWFVVQYYYNNGTQKGIVKSYEKLSELEIELFEKKEVRTIDNYEIQVDEFKSFELARSFQQGM